jgi:hypothetical protein
MPPSQLDTLRDPEGWGGHTLVELQCKGLAENLATRALDRRTCPTPHAGRPFTDSVKPCPGSWPQSIASNRPPMRLCKGAKHEK